MKLAMYQSKSSGFRFCVVTRDDGGKDISHVERTANWPNGCKFIKWMDGTAAPRSANLP